ncbi:MAG TPA: c-type cytochrome, partial [Pirellulales bacterium]|nr:c-type cytochrome [Pirellulales bacterium]
MRRVLTGVQAATAIALFLGPATAHLAAQDELARQARTILAERCHACHGDGGSAEGGLNFVLDRRRLVERKKIVPGDASQSLMFRQVKSGNMPKDDDPLSAAEIDTLKRWIEAGAPDFNPAAAQREFISSFAMMDFMQHDLESVEERLRPFVRYFTITHLYNAGLSDDELETYRVALSKLVNSLSWGSEIVRPKPIDPAMTVFRIDINDFGWTEKTWDCVIACNPYAVTFDMPAAKFCYSATKCALPHVRADWFVAAAAVPPLYHEILLLPTTDRVLEIRLHVDVARNQRTGRAARAGFNGSGVSTNNRLIERHGSTLTGGAYWKSYDFSGNDGKKNLFAHPIGPGGTNGFEHDGGEIIFNLPNGLQAYFLTDGKGTRIDKGPIAIVRDPRRPDSAVVNGLSCMSCHSSGMIPKDDQVRATVLATSSVYKKEEVEIVKALYPEKADFDALLRTDAERFANAVAKAGG